MALSDGFLWGGALAANQVEGGWNENGRGWVVTDVLKRHPDADLNNFSALHEITVAGIEAARSDLDPTYYPKRRAIDFVHRYR